MAEEEEVGEVWHEIRDALHRLAEQGESQTALLKEMAQQGKERGFVARYAILAASAASSIAVVGVFLSLAIAYGKVTEVKQELVIILSAVSVMNIALLMAVGLPSFLRLFRAWRQ